MTKSSEDKKARVSGVDLAIFSGKLNAICEEMGFVLQRSALSPNIKDRLDFSCALFDVDGKILAQAAHIPVHLGSMAYAMSSVVSQFEWFAGDMVVVNDPFQGGTHLPDVTVISPLFTFGQLTGFVVNRAHHANIGSDAPGSMPLSCSLEEEGLVIPPSKLFSKGVLDQALADTINQIDPALDSVLPEDFLAQISANKVGLSRLCEWVEGTFAGGEFASMCEALNDYGAQLMLNVVQSIPLGESSFHDELEGDGFGTKNITVACRIKHDDAFLVFDFSGTSEAVTGNLNCPESVTAAAVYYVVACLLPSFAPMCDGVFRYIRIESPKGCLLNASSGAAVAAGNVETSMRIVDVVQGAFRALGLDMPAASQGTMNNIAMGSKSPQGRWDYYETLAGGMGASSVSDGLDTVQCHMTNTLNTPVESLELHYPLRIERYAIRKGSSGSGLHVGGDGLVRTYCFLEAANVTLLTERRIHAPWGVNASAGMPGLNLYNGKVVADKITIDVTIDDKITIQTPGGGGWSPSR